MIYSTVDDDTWALLDIPLEQSEGEETPGIH